MSDELMPCKKCGNKPNVRFNLKWDTKTEVAYSCTCDWDTPQETEEQKAVRIWNEAQHERSQGG